jgi:hypothetical protein
MTKVWICKPLTAEAGKRQTEPTQPIQYGRPQDNPSKLQHKKGNEKTKKDTGKWWEYHKIPWHNTNECHSKKSLVADLKDFESEADSDSKPNHKGGKRIIDPEPSSMVNIAKVWPSEPKQLEEGERLFHLQMWVKGFRFISLSTMVVRRT